MLYQIPDEENVAELCKVIEEEAKEYYTYRVAGNEEKTTELGQRIWINMWNIRNYIFNNRNFERYRQLCVPPFYLERDEFLHEGFCETIPYALNTYNPLRGNFYFYFIYKLRNWVLNKLRDSYANRRQVRVKSEDIKIWELTHCNGREEWIVSEIKLRTNTLYNVTKEITDEDGFTWYEIEIHVHGKHYRVTEKDVIVYKDSPYYQFIDDGEDTESIGQEEKYEEIYIDIRGVMDIYVLNLLSLVQRLYGEKIATISEISPKSLTKYHIYKILYTEKLIEKLKDFYEYIITKNKTICEVTYEKEAIAVAMKELIDYLLKYKNCVTFSEIMRCPLKRYCDFSYFDKNREQFIEFPVLQEILVHFIVDKMNINREASSLRVSISRGRKEFDEQFQIFEKNTRSQADELL